MARLTKEFGKHYIVEFIDCNPERIKFVDDVKDAFLSAAQKSEAGMLENAFHQFQPYGVSGMIFIEESHFSIHTWPEDRYVAFDVLTCGKMYPERAIDELEKYFEAQKVETKIIPRGF